jgi:very-short-patch-repair endonuclease
LIVELQPKAAVMEARDKARIDFLIEHGYTVMLVSRQRVLEQPDKIIAQVRDALKR